MRRNFDRLARMVDEQLQSNPLSGDVFVFINRAMSRLKALYWDTDGYVLWYKRLEQGQFMIPGGEGIEIDRTAWMHMLEGVEVKIIKRQRRYVVNDRKK
jgi:transposase